MAGTPVSMDSYSVASPSISSDYSGRKRTNSEQGRELQAKMQDMISLQYQAQHHLSSAGSTSATAAGTGDVDDGDDDGIGKEGGTGGWEEGGGTEREKIPSSTQTPRTSISIPKSQTSSKRSTSRGVGSRSSSGIDNDEVVIAPHSSIRAGNSPIDAPLHEVVGRGTIFFSTNLKNSMGLSGSPVSSSSLATPNTPFASPPRPSYGGNASGANQSHVIERPPASSTSPDKNTLVQQQNQLLQLQHHLSPHVKTTVSSDTYVRTDMSMGGEEVTLDTASGGGLSRSKPMQQLSQFDQIAQQPQQQQSLFVGYGSIQDRNRHNFHYGKSNDSSGTPSNINRTAGGGVGNDVRNNSGMDDGDEDENDNLKGLLLHELYDSNEDDNPLSRIRMTCCSVCNQVCCLWAPIVQCVSQENLSRSFCYGSIDGLLTGSGLVAALMGLGVLHDGATDTTRLAAVALVTAACLADALAMAMGHVWNTYFVVSHHAEERTQERLLLESNKAEAKSKLVDMLLSQAGMLKIDAMSLVDALEGYPDLFVSALVGDSLLAGDDNHGDFHQKYDDEETDDGGGSGRENQTRTTMIPTGHGAGGSSFGSWKFPSYGRLQEDIMHFDTPEASNVNAVFRESQKEGCFMMMGFSVFAILPSLLWLVLPMCLHIGSVPTTDLTSGTDSNGPSSQPQQQHGKAISLSSIIMLFLTLMVWSLGVWKSRFVDSNWAVFGVESVAVLFVCVLSAYGVSALFLYGMSSGTMNNNDDDDDAVSTTVLGLGDL